MARPGSTTGRVQGQEGVQGRGRQQEIVRTARETSERACQTVRRPLEGHPPPPAVVPAHARTCPVERSQPQGHVAKGVCCIESLAEVTSCGGRPSHVVAAVIGTQERWRLSSACRQPRCSLVLTVIQWASLQQDAPRRRPGRQCGRDGQGTLQRCRARHEGGGLHGDNGVVL